MRASQLDISLSSLVEAICSSHYCTVLCNWGGGQGTIDAVPSVILRFTEVTCLGLWYVDRTVTGLLSCHSIAATHPLVRNMNSPHCIRSFLFRNIWQQLPASSNRTHGIKRIQSYKNTVIQEHLPRSSVPFIEYKTS